MQYRIIKTDKGYYSQYRMSSRFFCAWNNVIPQWREERYDRTVVKTIEEAEEQIKTYHNDIVLQKRKSEEIVVKEFTL